MARCAWGVNARAAALLRGGALAHGSDHRGSAGARQAVRATPTT
ncbi:hypothetical protein Salmuc_00700 [Salipiger mucosus DSM 16094]|uniref:Uncharacterized protein n=1 Tax=Salipiger mucosus DSM 16094 TaxID=1123237 RepID=S9Q7R2_9RHOB|nr:hypothetical protein Salmuc_00700 [Salipiger mucosus DSM 16094]